VRLRALAATLAVAALVVAGVTFSGAAFTALGANPGNGFSASNAFNLSATMTDPGVYVHQTVSLQATASDGEDGSSITSVKIQRSPAGAGTWTDVCTDTSSPYSCSFDTTAVSDGLYDFRAIAQNDAGGTATSTAVTNRRVDNTAPAAGITDPGTPLRGTVSVDATGTDGGSGVANVTVQRSPAGAGTWTDICTDSSSPYSCSFDTTGVSDGLYDLRAVTTDNAGNTTNSTTVTNRRIDNTAPTATMTNPGSPITATKSFDGTSTDTGGSGVASLTFQVSPTGAGTWSDMCSDTTSPYSCSYDTSALADGQYDFRSLASDNGGNTANSTVYSGAIVDNTAPTVSVTDPGQYLKGTLTLDATAGDGAGSGVANVKIQRSPAGAGTWTDVCTDTTSPFQCSTNTATWGGDGLYDLRAIATDNISLTTTSSTVTNRHVDNTAPTAGMTDPGAYLVGASVALSATGTDGGSGVANVTIQRSPAGAGAWTDVCADTTSPYGCTFDSTALSDGLYDFRAITTDNAGNAMTSATVTNRRVDNTAPTAGLTDPGAYLRGTTVALSATGTDGGSGVLNVKIQRAPTGTSTWTDICTDASSPYSCTWDTTGVTDGGYDLRAVATDNAGNVTNSTTVVNRVVDNTAPTAVDVQTTNVGGGTLGRPESGDTVIFTYSEQILATSILAGWNGSSTAVTLHINNQGGNDRLEVWNAANSAKLPLTNTFLALTNNYVTADTTFSATMVQSGSTITVTIGTLTGGTVTTDATTGLMSWAPSATATDLAGNLASTTAATESGTADTDF
jgi:Bacterial Ig domain